MKTWKSKFQKLGAVLLAICLIAGCMQISTVNTEAATRKSGTTYYHTQLCKRKGGKKFYPNGYYYDTGTRKVVCKGNTLTMYSSFHKSKNGKLNTKSKKAFVKYGKHTFKLTSKTKYCSRELDSDTERFITHYYSKSAFINSMKRLNGLSLWITVKNGKVTNMRFSS